MTTAGGANAFSGVERCRNPAEVPIGLPFDGQLGAKYRQPPPAQQPTKDGGKALCGGVCLPRQKRSGDGHRASPPEQGMGESALFLIADVRHPRVSAAFEQDTAAPEQDTAVATAPTHCALTPTATVAEPARPISDRLTR
jgi:hypothetical protein